MSTPFIYAALSLPPAPQAHNLMQSNTSHFPVEVNTTLIHLGTHPTDTKFIHGEGRNELFNAKDGHCSDLGLWMQLYQEIPPELITGWCLCEPGVPC